MPTFPREWLVSTGNPKEPKYRFYVPFALPDTPAWDISESRYSTQTEILEKFKNNFDVAIMTERIAAPSQALKNYKNFISLRVVAPSELKKRRHRQARSSRLQRELALLAKKVKAGDKSLGVTEELLRTALQATRLLAVANPENLAFLKKLSMDWPMIVSVGADISEQIRRETADLGKVSLRFQGLKIAALEKWEHAPARKWAYAILTVLDWNRSWQQRIPLSVRSGKQPPEWLICLAKMFLKIEPLPHWVRECATLPPFCKEVVPQWMVVGKEMLKYEMPDFDKAEEWRNWDRRAATRTKPGNNPRSKKRNDIFESIQSAMMTIAGENAFPKKSSQNPVTNKL